MKLSAPAAFILLSLIAFGIHAAEKSAVEETKTTPVVTPLPLAHSHNDYQHKRPLFDALDHGFCSVEADVFLVDGKLLVGHFELFLSSKRTLQNLYLDPLRERVRKNGGRVYPGGPEFTLLIEIKSEPKATYAALRKLLAEYDDILTVVEKGKATRKAVTVVITGQIPRDEIKADSPRYASIDGSARDLQSDSPADLIPWVSLRWTNYFKWRGEGEMPAEEKAKLRELAGKAGKVGRRLRFWDAPDMPAVWREMLDAKVGVIGADDLEGLRKVLAAR